MKLGTESQRENCVIRECFTPGPWDAPWHGIMDGHNFSNGDYEVYPPLGEAGPVAICSSAENARLVAAAPEMYEALISIREWLLFTYTLDDQSSLYLEAFVKANNLTNAAIAKAEGPQPL